MTIVKCKPNAKDNTHDISLSAYGRTFGISLERGAQAIVEGPVEDAPLLRKWVIRAITGDFKVEPQGLPDDDPDAFYMWLHDMVVKRYPILMHSAWEPMDNIFVLAQHPVLDRQYTTADGTWGGGLQLIISEIATTEQISAIRQEWLLPEAAEDAEE